MENSRPQTSSLPRHSFDSKLNYTTSRRKSFDYFKSKRKYSVTEPERNKRSSSLTTNFYRNNQPYDVCLTSRNQNGEYINGGHIEKRNSKSRTSRNSSVNSLFLINRVRSFTWKLKRQIIQSSIDSEFIPIGILFPSGDAEINKPIQRPYGSMKLRKKSSNSSNIKRNSRLRYSTDARFSKSFTKEIVCSEDDFKSIIANSSTSSLSYRRQIQRKSIQQRQYNCSAKSNVSEPHKITRSANVPRRSLSEGSLIDVYGKLESVDPSIVSIVEENIPEKVKDLEIERYHEIEKSSDFNSPNIQILGDAIQEHLKLLMQLQFGSNENQQTNNKKSSKYVHNTSYNFSSTLSPSLEDERCSLEESMPSKICFCCKRSYADNLKQFKEV